MVAAAAAVAGGVAGSGAVAAQAGAATAPPRTGYGQADLQHTSGIYDYTNDLAELSAAPEAFNQHRFDDPSPEQLVATAMRHSPGFAPGTSWDYSNTNYLLAGMVIRQVTGRAWWQEVRSRITVPLGLRHTFYPGARPELPRPHAQGYLRFGPGGPIRLQAALVDHALCASTA